MLFFSLEIPDFWRWLLAIVMGVVIGLVALVVNIIVIVATDDDPEW